MWPKKYKDYPKDCPLKKEQVVSGKGIIGCEMHEKMGWGELTDEKKPNKNTPLHSEQAFQTKL